MQFQKATKIHNKSSQWLSPPVRSFLSHECGKPVEEKHISASESMGSFLVCSASRVFGPLCSRFARVKCHVAHHAGMSHVLHVKVTDVVPVGTWKLLSSCR